MGVYSVCDVTERYGVSDRTVRGWISKGWLNCSRDRWNGPIYISDDDLREFEADQIKVRAFRGEDQWTVREVSKKYDRCEDTVYKWIKKGYLDGKMASMSAGYRFSSDDLDKLDICLSRMGEKEHAYRRDGFPELYDKWQNGDAEAFDLIRKKIEFYCNDRASGILARYGYSPDEIDEFDEIVNEGIESALQEICGWENSAQSGVLHSRVQTRAKRVMNEKIERVLIESQMIWNVSTDDLFTVDDVAERLMDISTVLTCMRTLTPREQKILEIRYGLSDGIPKTLEETALIIGLTSRERVRQIEVKALRKLRSRLPKLNREVV